MTKRLYRSNSHKVVAGVCGGIGQYVKIDPVLVRLGFIALAITETGLGLIAYVAAMFIIPVEPGGNQDNDVDASLETQVVNASGETEQSRRTLGIILIGLGAGLIIYRLGYPNLLLFSWYRPFVDISLWPLALIILGAIVLLRPQNHS